VVAEGRLAEDMWDIDKVSQFLGIPKGTLYQWRSSGRGPRSYKPGNTVLYDPFDVRAYLIATAKEPRQPREPTA
jgi:predicted DNA-binding transcriptional regulator AlpA